MLNKLYFIAIPKKYDVTKFIAPNHIYNDMSLFQYMTPSYVTEYTGNDGINPFLWKNRFFKVADNLFILTKINKEPCNIYGVIINESKLVYQNEYNKLYYCSEICMVCYMSDNDIEDWCDKNFNSYYNFGNSMEKIGMCKICNRKYLDKMIYSPDYLVKSYIASLRIPKYLDRLVMDSNVNVRFAVAVHGEQIHKNILKRDTNNYVRMMASK